MRTVGRRRSFFSNQVKGPSADARISPPPAPYAEDRVFSLFEPDILLSEQYLDSIRTKAIRDPEKRLMLAILEDAISCFQAGLVARSNRQQALCREADEWIFENEREWPFSFENLCEALDLDAGYIRKGLIRWRTKALSGEVKAKVYRITRLGGDKKRPAKRLGERTNPLPEAAGF